MKVTIEQIAEKMGYSISTVSRALNGNTRINEKTREMIKREAVDMGYFNSAIQAVIETEAKSKIPNVGVSLYHLASPFSSEIIHGIRDVCAQNGYRMIIMDSNRNVETEQANIDNLLDLGVRGILFHPAGISTQQYMDRLGQKVPAVHMCYRFKRGEANCISIDEKNAIFRSTEYLIQLGHRKIAFAGMEPKFDRRKDGYVKALNMYGIVCRERDIFRCPATYDGGYDAMREIIQADRGYTAVVCVNDFTAYGIMDYLHKHQYSVPEDYSVIGLDNLEVSSYSRIGLTTVSQPRYEIGKLACETLLEKIKQQDLKIDTYKILESPLVIRQSCRCLASTEKNALTGGV